MFIISFSQQNLSSHYLPSHLPSTIYYLIDHKIDMVTSSLYPTSTQDSGEMGRCEMVSEMVDEMVSEMVDGR